MSSPVRSRGVDRDVRLEEQKFEIEKHVVRAVHGETKGRRPYIQQLQLDCAIRLHVGMLHKELQAVKLDS